MVRAAKLQKPTVHKDQTQMPTGGNMLTGDVFRIHLGLVKKAQAAVDAVKKGLKKARREAQDAGINLKDMDEMIRMSDQEPETVKATILRKATYASWMGISPGVVQGDLFAHADAEESDVQKAEREGYEDGLEGVTAKGDRYDTSNPIGKARLKGWNKGQEVLRRHLEEAMMAKKQKEKEAKAKAKAKAKKAEPDEGEEENEDAEEMAEA